MATKAAKLLLALASAGGCMAAPAVAFAATPACTTLPNTAYVQYDLGGTPVSLASNPAPVRVAELLDLRLTTSATTIAVAQGELQLVPFTLVNAGNGDEAFVLDGRITGGDAVIEGFAFDRDGNGSFDPSADLAIPARAATPQVAAGGTLKLFALVRGGTQSGGALSVTARALTGAGVPGNALAGQGDGGCDAVIGATSATGTVSVTLTAAPGSDTSQVELVKSQSFAGMQGSEPTPGTTVTYTIESRFGGSGVVRSARLADLIPPGTAYIPGSIRLDGAALSDATDGDAGDFDGTGIHVQLGDVAAPATDRKSVV